jgi:hypothetical protein
VSLSAAHALLNVLVHGTACSSQMHPAAQGDWGTQFGMLTQHMSELRPGGLAEVGQEDISDLLKLYKYTFLRTADVLVCRAVHC